MRTIARLSAIALAIAASNAAHALATYSFTYDGTQYSCFDQASCAAKADQRSWSGTITVTLTGGVDINSLKLDANGIDWTSGHAPAPYADGFFGSSWDGYTGRQIDPNTEIAISVDGSSPLHLSNNFAADVSQGLASFGGNAQSASALYLFGNGVDIAYAAHGVETHGHAILTAVPEPESWALMLAGFGIIGVVGKRRLGRRGAMTALRYEVAAVGLGS